MSRHQNTINEPTELAGLALFSGAEAVVRLSPAEPGTGIMFVRADLPDNPVVPVMPDTLSDGFQCTVLRRDEVQIRSVEHLLSACMALRVDNLLVEVKGDEMPASGGCAAAFAEAILKAGICEQNAEKETFTFDKPVALSENGSSIVGMPADEGLTLSYVLEFDAPTEGRPVIPPQVVTLKMDPETYMRDIARARTLAGENAYDEFQKRGLGGGVTDDNAVVIFRDGTFRSPRSRRETQLRFPNEFARHKVLDLLGDLALSGLDLQGKIVAVRSGHKLNTAFALKLRAIMDEAKAPEDYMDIREVQRILPHRYPFLMVDRVLRVEGDNRIIGLKNVSMNEHFFQGHYPDYPIMPGVLQLEALAQVAGVLLLQKLEHTGKLAVMVAMDEVKFRRSVQPGDQLVLEAEVVRARSRIFQVKGRGLVGGQVACEAQMTFMLVDPQVL